MRIKENFVKKKLLFTCLIASLLVCLFVITVSASEIPEWPEEVTIIEGMSDKPVFGADGTIGATSRVLMSDGVAYPAYYICKNSTSLGITFTELSDYSAADVVRIEIPKGTISTPTSALKTENGFTALKTASFPEGFTTLGGYTFKATTDIPSALVSVTLPSTLESIGESAFTDCGSLEKLVIPEGVTVIPKNMAYHATSLKTLVLPSTLVEIKDSAFRSADLSESGIVIPEGCKSIGKYAFKGSNALSVIVSSTVETALDEAFAESSSLINVYCKCPTLGYRMFYTCPNIQTVILENTVAVGDYAFCNPNGGTTQINKLVLPEGLTSIGAFAFTRSALTELVLPSTLETIGSSVFINSTSLQKIVVLGPILGQDMFKNCSSVNELVLTENFVTLGKDALSNVSQTSFITYYTGTDHERIKSVCSGTTRLSQGKYYSYEDYESGNYTYNKFMVIYDVNLCVAAFDGVHTEPMDDGNCETALICSYCKEHIFRQALSHVSSERVTYPNYMEEGEYYVGCTNEGCTFGSVEKLEALITCNGFSVDETNGNGIVVSYRINEEAIARYCEITGKTVKYGLYAATKNALGNSDILDANGVPAKGAIKAEVNTGFIALQIKMVGIDDKDALFTMGAYLEFNEGEIKEYAYIQSENPLENEKYCFVSYNSLIKENN